MRDLLDIVFGVSVLVSVLGPFALLWIFKVNPGRGFPKSVNVIIGIEALCFGVITVCLAIKPYIR
jgi:hypothetical protein